MTSRESQAFAAWLGVTYQHAIGNDFTTADPTSFVQWIANCWSLCCPSEPVRTPDAVSVDRRGIHRIRWYATDDHVLGYVPGTRGGFVVPIEQLAQV